MASGATPTTINLPRTARPGTSAAIALPLGAVAKIALAPPILCNAAATSSAAVSR